MSSSAQAAPSLHLKTLTNFSSEWFVGGVSCSSVTADQHSPSNLIATDPQSRSRGLRVEHYIRPPVTVSLDFCFPVTVWCVLLCLDLPQQAQGRVELVGGVGRNGGECRICAGPLVGTSGAVLAARCRRPHRPAAAAASKLSEWVVHRSYASKDLHKQECIESLLRDVTAVRHLRQLQVKITRWTGPKPISIKWLEVWGVVSAACSREEKNCFLEKFHASTMIPKMQGLPPRMFQDEDRLVQEASTSQSSSEQLASSGGVAVSTISSSTSTANPSKTLATHANIPEEFLDQLTFELMALPMLLPSGHCVDRSTLDRLARTDTLYGRPPTDPFTGIAFTGSCKPEFNVHLKSQLDQYLSNQQCSASSPACGRTLGSSMQIQQHRTRTGKSPVIGVTGVSPDTGDTLRPSAKKRSKLCSEDSTLDQGSSSALGDHKSPVGQEEGGQGTHLPSRMPQHHATAHATAFDMQVGSSLEAALNQVLRGDKQQ